MLVTAYILFHETENKFNQHFELLIFIVTDRNSLHYIQIKKLIAWYLFKLLVINRNSLHYIQIKKLIAWCLFELLIINRNSFYYTWIKKFWNYYCCLILVWIAHDWLKFILLYSDQEILKLFLLVYKLLVIDC